MQPYYVISPEYTTGGYYMEPPEYGCDCAEVEALTKREAVIAGVQKILRDGPDRSWARRNRQDGQSPFAGYRAELARCGHGYPHFILVNGRAVDVRCWGCDAGVRSFERSDSG